MQERLGRWVVLSRECLDHLPSVLSREGKTTEDKRERSRSGPESKTERTLHDEDCLETKQVVPEAARIVSVRTLKCDPGDGHLSGPRGQQSAVRKAGSGACQRVPKSWALKVLPTIAVSSLRAPVLSVVLLLS